MNGHFIFQIAARSSQQCLWTLQLYLLLSLVIGAFLADSTVCTEKLKKSEEQEGSCHGRRKRSRKWSASTESHADVSCTYLLKKNRMGTLCNWVCEFVAEEDVAVVYVCFCVCREWS